jgi:hypothetical protein
VTQRIVGAPGWTISIGAPVPAQIAVAETPENRIGEPHGVRYEIDGAIPPHSYAWVRALWRSYYCYLNAVGGNQGTSDLWVVVKVGWLTRTEDIQLPTEFAVSATNANVHTDYCQAHDFQPMP